MAEYMLCSKGALVHKVSKDLPPAHAAFAEPLSCALHGVERAEITLDDIVVVAGCGPIGLGMIAGSRAKNARLVLGLDMAQAELEVARQCGADVIINIGSNVTVAWSIISDDKELNVRGAHLGPRCWPAAIEMIESGTPPMDETAATNCLWSGFSRAWIWSPQATSR